MTKAQLIVVRVLAAVMALVCFFFVFYTARLLWVTHGLTTIRGGWERGIHRSGRVSASGRTFRVRGAAVDENDAAV